MNRMNFDGIEIGTATREQLAGLTGLEVLQAMMQRELPAPSMGRALDFMLIEAEEGRALFEGRPDNRHFNPGGTVHGGYAATLLDSCMTCACQTTAKAGEFYTTVEIKVTFLRPLPGDGQPVRAEGKVIARTRRTAFAEGRLTDARGRLCATASTTCMLIDRGDKA